MKIKKEALVEKLRENTLSRLEFDMVVKVLSDKKIRGSRVTRGVTESVGESVRRDIIEEKRLNVYISRCGN